MRTHNKIILVGGRLNRQRKMKRIIEALKRKFKRSEAIHIVITKEQIKSAFESKESLESLIDKIEYRLSQERVGIDILELNEKENKI